MATLKRSITFPLLTLYGLGTILGAGIYVLIGKVAAVAGFYAPLAFVMAALLAGVSGYSYAALSSRYPKSAGEAVYVQAAFQLKPLSSLVGWMVLLTGIVSAATITNGFVGYLNVFVAVDKITAVTVALSLLALLACWGVSQSVIAAGFVTVLEIFGLLLVLFIAGDVLLTVPGQALNLVPSVTDSGAWFAVLLGAFIAFYAFIGFEDMVNMAEEVKTPESTLPKAIIAALLLSSVLYLLIALVAVLSLPLEELKNSTAPMKDILSQHNAKAATVIALISLIAVINGALVQIIMGARVLYGMGRQGLAARVFAQINPSTQTPIIATLLVVFVVWLFAVALPLITLAKITSFIIIFVFMLINMALAKLLINERKAGVASLEGEVMSIALSVPVIGVVLCAAFLLLQSYQLIYSTVISH